MGKRQHVENDSTLDTPTTKKRKPDANHQQQQQIHQNADTQLENVSSQPADYSNAEVTFSLTTDIVDGVILTDLCAKKWRCGKPIGEYCFSNFSKLKKKNKNNNSTADRCYHN